MNLRDVKILWCKITHFFTSYGHTDYLKHINVSINRAYKQIICFIIE